MITPMRLLVIIFIFLRWGFDLSAAGVIKNHEIRNYISNSIPVTNQNWNIYQNPRNGIMYFANTLGLVAFDGLQEKVYKLPYNRGVRSVCIDPQGTLFTGGFEEFGYWKKDKDFNLSYVSLVDKVQVEHNDEIWKIYYRNHKIYFQSFTTIYVYDYHIVKAIKAPFTMLFMFPMGPEFVVQILGNGLYTFDHDTFHFIPGSRIFANEKIHAFVPYGKSQYLIGTANHGLYLFSEHSIQPFRCEASDYLKYNTCNAGIEINDSLYLFGTILNGIVLMNKEGSIKNIYNYSNGLKNNTVLSLYKDMDQGIWIGLDQGVNYLEFNAPMVRYSNITGSIGTIYTLLRQHNKLYIGSNQGLFEATIERSETQYNFMNVKMIPGSQGQVWTLRDFDNQILCGHNEGTYLVKDNRLEMISGVTGGWTIQALKDKLIEGTYTGLVIFEKGADGAWKFRNTVKGYSEPTRHLEVDYLGYVWATHNQGGIYKIELNDRLDSVVKIEFFKNIDGRLDNIDVYKINNRIVFTSSQKLYTFDYDQDRIVPFTLLNKDLGEYCKASQIIRQQKNLYWLVLENKIALFNIPLDFHSEKRFEVSQKNIHSPGNDLDIVRLDDRNLVLPNRQGLLLLNTHNIREHNLPIRLQFSRLQFQGHGKQYVLGPTNSEDTKIPFVTNNLTVYFADPSRFNNDDRLYYYRIPQLEDTWHSTTLNNFTYLNLGHGEYTLQLRPDRSSEIREYHFEILPPWYLSYPAYLLYFVILCALLYLGRVIFINELNKQKKLVEMELKRNSLESELDYKSSELLLTMRYLIQKNEILTMLKEEVDTLKQYSAKYPVKPINSIEKIIRQGLDLQTENWKSAMNNLKLSQQGYFRRLKEKFPDLTPNDLRLCSYLSMNFTTKEIAHLLNISARGVEIGRYRLRKKMNLDHDVNLSEYLMSESIGHLEEGKKQRNHPPKSHGN